VKQNISVTIDPRISIVAAMGLNRVIGNDNKLPWDLPEDLARFYQLVQNKTVVMGRKTYAAIGHPITSCRNIVLSRTKNLKIPGCEVHHSFKAVLIAIADDKEIMIIGGAEVYKRFLPYAAKMYLTLIQEYFTGNVHFPDLDFSEWREVSRVQNFATTQNPYNYDFVIFERVVGQRK